VFQRRFVIGLVVLACGIAVAMLPTLQSVPGCVRSAVWPPALIALHTAADAAIAIAYIWIPITLIVVWRIRKDIPVNWTLLCFAAFIVLCGATHVMGIVTIWKPLYWLSGEVKAATALISLMTAWLLTFRVFPILLSTTTTAELKVATDRADQEAIAAKASLERAETLEKRTRELQEAFEKLRLQEEAIHELSTPILEVYPGVLLVPLIGAIDSHRAAQLLEVVAEQTSARKAETIILDLTGVPVVDTAVANSLMKASSIVQLLGARCIATGIRPAVASTMVELGLEIGKVMETRGALSQGLALALGDRHSRPPSPVRSTPNEIHDALHGRQHSPVTPALPCG
jgi:anti-anti-sigma regulatory factor